MRSEGRYFIGEGEGRSTGFLGARRGMSVSDALGGGLVRLGAADALVFPPSRGDGTMTGFRSMFARIVKAGGLPADVTPHVLRHSFASLANDLGYSEATIGMLIGHKGTGSVTRGYIHLGDSLAAAADRIAATILRKLAGEGAAAVVEGPGAQRIAG